MAVEAPIRDIKMVLTNVYDRNAAAYLGGYRRAKNEGGTAATKTWSILQLLSLIARHSPTPGLISVVSESLPHLKRGCIRDWFNILGESQDNNPAWSKTEFLYTFPNGYRVEFFGADDAGKVRGPRRKILFLNECNNIPWETARGLDIRTEQFTFMDWNPVAEFWAHEQWLGPENVYIHSTYMDAKGVLPKAVVANIESNRSDKNWWNVFGLGLIGKLDALIWPNMVIVDDLPQKADWTAWAYGLDFGFTNPTALVKVALSDGKLYWDECLYQARLTNADLIERLTHEERADIYPDSADPNRIEEINRAGFVCVAANKDVKLGIDVVKRQPLHITKRSVALIKEVRKYSYRKDRGDKILEEPCKIDDHGCDAGRYATLGLTERYGFATAKRVVMTGQSDNAYRWRSR